MKKVYQAKLETNVEKIKEKINERERKRYSLPQVELTDTEHGTLIALAQGRRIREIDKAIQRIDRSLTYHIVVRELLRKFEAFTIPHLAYKAIKLGIIKLSDITK